MNCKRLLKAMADICKQAPERGALSAILVEDARHDTVRLTATDGRALASVAAIRRDVDVEVRTLGWGCDEDRIVPPMNRPINSDPYDSYPDWRKVVPSSRLVEGGSVGKLWDADTLRRLTAVKRVVTDLKGANVLWTYDSPSAISASIEVGPGWLLLGMPLRKVPEDGSKREELEVILGHPVTMREEPKTDTADAIEPKTDTADTAEKINQLMGGAHDA